MYSGFSDFLPADRIRFNEPMKNHTTFKIGGPVDIMVMPRDINDIKAVLSFCRDENIPFFVFGLGTNLLVRDKGFRGVGIKLGRNLTKMSISGTRVYSEAGVRLSDLSKRAAAHSLSGLEFAEGIPGSVGGAVVMNAGAYDGEMKKVLVKATAVGHDGKIKDFSLEEMKLGYRKSIFQDSSYIVVSAVLELKPGDKEKILAKMREFARRRTEKQPLEFPSAGSTFKRPEGYYVGPMLEKMGLKGFGIGGAQVSEKHAGFIINKGNASADDVLNLIKYIQQKAREKFDVDLQPEIRIIGEE